MRQILLHSLALYAASRGSTDTIPTIPDLSLLLGSVRVATPTCTPISETDNEPDQASRLFYCSKANSRDRRKGNNHPTVKPHALMRWLCRLITPPEGGIVLDPFSGSCSTGLACRAEGLGFIGIEKDPDYHRIAEARLATMEKFLFA